jgi:hypothetical protein
MCGQIVMRDVCCRVVEDRTGIILVAFGSLSCRPARALRRQTGVTHSPPAAKERMQNGGGVCLQGVVDVMLLETLLCRGS